EVLHEAGYRFGKTRTWCPTGTAIRVRKAGTVTVKDPKAQEKNADWQTLRDASLKPSLFPRTMSVAQGRFASQRLCTSSLSSNVRHLSPEKPGHILIPFSCMAWVHSTCTGTFFQNGGRRAPPQR
ncbi:MAG TPA: hypothetical protein VFN02_13430, partial [Ktedonobacteraceae bacterium]|nr:hypothetical protein [Ktedonobacteraceae bacterium]